MREILDEPIVEDTTDMSIQDKKIKIRLGEHMGEIGIVITKDGEDLQIQLVESNEIIKIKEKFVIFL